MLVFLISILAVMGATMLFMGTITLTLLRIGVLTVHHPSVFILFFAVFSITIATFFAKIVGDKLLSPVTEISDATKEVARGNFDIVLDESHYINEIRTMAHNFNIMTEELSRTEILRNDFIQNISHEFKTPLSAIEGYAALLQDPFLCREKREIYTEKIIQNTKRLSSLTESILQLSRLESCESAAEKKTYSLDEQIRESILMFENEWTAKNIDLDIDLEPVNYCGICDLLAQVWQNLIGNAVKFSQKGGNVRVRLYREDEDIVVIVADDGIGMDEETQKRIFEKFYQGDTSHKTEGNGLGLTLAKRIIDLHEGCITAEGKQKEGSIFTVRLPEN